MRPRVVVGIAFVVMAACRSAEAPAVDSTRPLKGGPPTDRPVTAKKNGTTSVIATLLSDSTQKGAMAVTVAP